jgi:hypothetical protein
MALEALGINPYTGTGTNYIQDIVNEFDGTQIGDPNLINDDIFSIFPLVKAGYSVSDNIIQKVVANIISKQNPDGSWVGGVDMTSAAIQALELTPSLSGVSQSISKARAYLVGQQQLDGGFGSADATSWTLQAISSIGESATNWQNGLNNPYDYLYNLQQSDGGIGSNSLDTNTRIWATAYAIPAALGRPWASILNSFSKPTTSSATNVIGGAIALSAPAENSIATTSAIIKIATTTPVSKEPEISAAETRVSESVVGAKRTNGLTPVSAALPPTNAFSQSAAVVLSQSASTSPTSFKNIALAVIGSVVVLGGIYLFLII